MDISRTLDGVLSGLHAKEKSQSLHICNPTAVRGSKLVDRNEQNIFRFYFDKISGDEKCLTFIAMGSVTCSF